MTSEERIKRLEITLLQLIGVLFEGQNPMYLVPFSLAIAKENDCLKKEDDCLKSEETEKVEKPN